nr:hypothetical protein Itr_chr02CG24500 [Ipomoea trifida]
MHHHFLIVPFDQITTEKSSISIYFSILKMIKPPLPLINLRLLSILNNMMKYCLSTNPNITE